MRALLLQWYRTGSYLLSTVFFLWFGDRVQKHLVILKDSLDGNVLLVLRESPYLMAQHRFSSSQRHFQDGSRYLFESDEQQWIGQKR